jgi:zinc protease
VLTLHYGTPETLKGQMTAAGMLPAQMMAGTKKHDRQALREEMDSLGIRIGAGGGGGGGRGGRGGGAGGQLRFSVQAKRDTLPRALGLLREILREPAFPTSDFETAKLRMATSLTGSRTEPGALARNKLNRALSAYTKDDVRYLPTLEESLELAQHVTLEQLRTLYETQIGGSHAELGVVGDFDLESTLRLVKEMLSGWESKTRFERIDHKVADNGTGFKEEIITPDKANAEYLAGLSFALADSDPDYPALLIGNFIFGGSTLASRLGDRIRQKDGLSYGANSSFTASSLDPVASLTLTISTNPVNIDKVASAVMEELQRYLKDGPTEKEVSDAKRAFVEAQKVGRSSDGAIAAEIVSNLNTSRTFAFAADREKAILALTPARVAEAFRKHIDPNRLVIIRAGDFQNSPTK